MAVLRFKPGTKVETLDTNLFAGLLALVHNLVTEFGGEVVITSVNDGVHKIDSLHYVGRAVDIRCKYYDRARLSRVIAEFKRQYDEYYDLVWERPGTPGEHLHCEYDPGNRNR